MTTAHDIGSLARQTVRRVPGLLITTRKQIARKEEELATLRAEEARLVRQMEAVTQEAA